jgi:hypothetical protein
VNQQCPACGKVGHIWTNCDMLAMAITIKHFMDGQASPETLRGIESDWLTRHRGRLQQDSRSLIKSNRVDIKVALYCELKSIVR